MTRKGPGERRVFRKDAEKVDGGILRGKEKRRAVRWTEEV